MYILEICALLFLEYIEYSTQRNRAYVIFSLTAYLLFLASTIIGKLLGDLHTIDYIRTVCFDLVTRLSVRRNSLNNYFFLHSIAQTACG